MILPTVATFIIASVAMLFTNQANLFAFFGEQALTADYTIGYYLYKMVSNPANMNDYPYASALGLVCTLIAFPLTMLVKKLLDRGEA